MMLREFEDKENQMAELDEQVWPFWRVELWRHFNWVVSKWRHMIQLPPDSPYNFRVWLIDYKVEL